MRRQTIEILSDADFWIGAAIWLGMGLLVGWSVLNVCSRLAS